jgi:hypothetical protein
MLAGFATNEFTGNLSRKGAKAQRRKGNLLETRQRFAPLRLCGRTFLHERT